MIKEVFKIATKILYAIVGTWLFFFILTQISDCTNQKEKPVGSYWTNIDEDRPLTDIKHFNIQEKTVEYREPNLHRNIPSYTGSNNEGGVIITSGNVTIKTDLSAEEIIEQLDIEYEDIMDYMGSELR